MSEQNANVAKLSEYDFVIVADASGSMSEDDCAGGATRWNHMQESALSIAREVGQFDEDGLGLVIFGGDSITSKDGVTAKNIKEVFATRRPAGTTPLAEALTEAFKLAGKSDKKDFVIVFTDGVPNDKAAAAKVIIEQSNKQETDDALTVLFIQVGHDAPAAAFLKSLDDDLKGAKFDIVDAKTQAEADGFASITDLILAAIAD